MKREYEITMTRTITYRAFVIAENEDDAIEQFYDAIASGDAEIDEHEDYPDDPMVEETGWTENGYTD